MPREENFLAGGQFVITPMLLITADILQGNIFVDEAQKAYFDQ